MEQQYIGIDLHKAFFQACALRSDGTRVWERRVDRTPEGLTAFAACGITTAAMAVEATGPTWRFVDAGHAPGARVCRRPAQDATESRVCGKDGSA